MFDKARREKNNAYSYSTLCRADDIKDIFRKFLCFEDKKANAIHVVTCTIQLCFCFCFVAVSLSSLVFCSYDDHHQQPTTEEQLSLIPFCCSIRFQICFSFKMKKTYKRAEEKSGREWEREKEINQVPLARKSSSFSFFRSSTSRAKTLRNTMFAVLLVKTIFIRKNNRWCLTNKASISLPRAK